MSEMIRKTESTYFGPWLLDKAALDALDEIIDEQWARLEAHRKRRIDNAVRRERDRLRKSDSNAGLSEGKRKVEAQEIRQRLENDYPDDGRTIILTLLSGNKVRANSIREAANDLHCQDQEVAKVEVKLRCGGIRGDLVVPTPDKNHGLSLVTLPEASEQADELFVRLNRWSEEYKPDWFRRLHGSPPGVVVFLGGSLMILVSMIGMFTGSISTKNALKDEARKLVIKGVKPEDYGRALEILLQQSVRPPGGDDLIILPTWYYAATSAMIVVVLLLSFGARTAFEIGKGATIVRRQKRYDTFLRRSIPAFLIMGALASIVGTIALELVRSK